MGPHGIDIFALLLTVFWVWMLIDALTNTRLRGNSKFGWVIFIFLTHVLGAAIYFFTARSRSQRIAQYQNTQQYIQQRPVPPPSTAVPYYQPSRSPAEAAPGPEVSGDYREGYQGTQGPIGIQTLTPQPMDAESRADWQGDEHPTAAYPVLPPQPMPPQSQ